MVRGANAYKKDYVIPHAWCNISIMVGPHLSRCGHLFIIRYMSSSFIRCPRRLVSSYVTPPLGVTRSTSLVFAHTNPFLSLSRFCMVSFCTSSLYIHISRAHISHRACFFRFSRSFLCLSAHVSPVPHNLLPPPVAVYLFAVSTLSMAQYAVYVLHALSHYETTFVPSRRFHAHP